MGNDHDGLGTTTTRVGTWAAIAQAKGALSFRDDIPNNNRMRRCLHSGDCGAVYKSCQAVELSSYRISEDSVSKSVSDIKMLCMTHEMADEGSQYLTNVSHQA